ncbi:NepR family anti-sigma factor [Maritalea sp. S77]|uniref:NepR family anti-sigma factor n=1 Tax=Maritalea sp. S77 TaxID=3415125 RepID=UPI003C7CD3A3
MTENANKNGVSLNGKTAQSADGSEMISEKLKQLYDSVADEGISDRFLDLLEKLDAAEKNSSDEEPSS